MAVLRAALVGCLLLAVATAGQAQKDKDKIDKTKLVGTWTFVKTNSKHAPPADAVIKAEFTKDGKVTVTFTVKDKTLKMSGTYTVKGDQLTTVMKGPDGQDKKEIATIKELTDKKFVQVEKEGDKIVTTEFKK
jgi:uncharacterized protein (TIGR03066 family)